MVSYEVFSARSADTLSGSELEELNVLLTELSSTARPLTLASLAKILELAILVGIREVKEESSQIVGMGLLSPLQGLSGFRMHVDDVCVAKEHRGHGLGKRLMKALLAEAHEAGALSADLTSRPDREAANALYQSLGFHLRETNVYRFTFCEEPPA